MIPLDLPQFCFLTITVLLAVVVAVWLSYAMVRRIREQRAERKNIRCTVCGCAFPAPAPAASEASQNPEACPRCGTLNELNKNIIIY